MPLDQVKLGKFQIMPAMTQAEYDALKADIRTNGVLEAIAFDQDGAIVDGHHRFEAWGDLIEEGVELEMFPKLTLNFSGVEDRLAYSLSKNLNRRHMTREQRAELAVTLRKRGISLTRIASMLGVSAKTIWYDLDEASEENKAEIAQVAVQGADGKLYQPVLPPRINVSVATYASADKVLKQMNAEIKGAEAAPVGETAREILQDKWQVKPGQVWHIPSNSATGASHRIGCGDSRSEEFVSQLFDSSTASLLWTDPPYGVKYVGKTKDSLELEGDDVGEGLEQLLLEAFGLAEIHSEDATPFYICHPPGAISWVFGDVLRTLEWRMHETLVWRKDSMVLGHSDYHLMHEPIYYGWMPGTGGRPGRGTPQAEGGKWYGNDAQVSVFDIPRPKRSETHPTMKPTELIVKHLLNSSGWKDRVYDPFIGSGSTLAACEQVGRVCYGIDIGPEDIAVTLDRAAAMGLTPALA